MHFKFTIPAWQGHHIRTMGALSAHVSVRTVISTDIERCVPVNSQTNLHFSAFLLSYIFLCRCCNTFYYAEALSRPRKEFLQRKVSFIKNMSYI